MLPRAVDLYLRLQERDLLTARDRVSSQTR